MTELIKTTKKDFLNQNIDEIINLLATNTSYRKIAEIYGVSIQTLWAVLNEPENIKRKEEALEIASEYMMERAENQLNSIEADDTNALVRKKTELAEFYVYLAKVKNRKIYDLNYKKENEKESGGNIIIIPSGQSAELLGNLTLNNKDNKDIIINNNDK